MSQAPPAVQDVTADPGGERVVPLPSGQVSDGHHVHMPLQRQRGDAVAAHHPDDPVPLAPRRLGAGEPVALAQVVEVELPHVHVHAGLGQQAGEVMLQLRLGVGAGDAGHADGLGQQVHGLGVVDGVQHPEFHVAHAHTFS
ncbi:hypothetical protein ACFSTC_37250 [Nonomuraea ferruginea]